VLALRFLKKCPVVWAGYYYPAKDECIIPTGKTEVYVHWILPLNNTLSNFCDGSTTPRYYEAKEGCNCID
jgi:hypothetical protein